MKKLSFIILAFLCINKSFSLITVTSNADSGAGTLRAALTGPPAAGETIEFSLGAGSLTIGLDSALPSIVDDLIIDGRTNVAGTVIIEGVTDPTPGFVITNGTVSIFKLSIKDCSSARGDGGDGQTQAGGGGGMGAGGGVFVNTGATVTLTDLTFDGCSAQGGNGGDGNAFGLGIDNGGGGGGLGGDGADNNVAGGGGGGGLYSDAAGQTPGTGGGAGGVAAPGSDATADFGGGGGSGSTTGGDGLFAGGGGGGRIGAGGDGNVSTGFGGGGGGGGGAGGTASSGGTGGTGGGNGAAGDGGTLSGGGGGGGAGFGGAVFLRTGGTLSFNSDITSNQSTFGGALGSGGSIPAGPGIGEGDGVYLMSSTTLTLNPGAGENKTIAAEISGAGAVTKNGLGTYNITATNTYTGATTVSVGTLVVNGSIATSSATTVAAGATLKGTGSVSVTTLNGILKPGNSIGTITVAGAYTQNSGSTLQIEIEPSGNASKVDITGAATINNSATLEVTAQGGDYSTDQVYTILDAAGGRTGEFSTFTVTNPGELDGGTLAVSYTTNLVQLLFTADSTTIPTATITTFSSNNLINQANRLQSNILFDQSILRYYQNLCPCHKKGARPYFLANYLHGHFKTSTYTQGGPFSLSGALVGFDYWTKSDIVIGGFFDYLRSWSESDDHVIKTTSNNYILSAYIQKLWDNFFVEGAISGSLVDFEMDRFLNRSKINDASPDGFSLSTQTKGAYICRFNNMALIPSLALRYFYNQINSYVEKEEILNRLDIKAQKSHVLEALIGVHFSNTFLVSFGAIIPQIEISYIADVLRNKTTFDAKLEGSSTERSVSIKPNPDNTIRLKTALDFRFHNCSILNVSYAASFSTHQRMSNEVHLGYRIDF